MISIPYPLLSTDESKIQYYRSRGVPPLKLSAAPNRSLWLRSDGAEKATGLKLDGELHRWASIVNHFLRIPKETKEAKLA
jgi:hypothetical protein